ncbi:GxxExxY protein [Xylanibacter ruminicola]|uniref:GxxExxY protein n=1 Tax=Xylanibacter ruminicola TaxID=839 RepID=A0A1H5UIV1_XYLRU|nr:GxxExxY protein [Xylanibacter ruminicola]SEF74995.1 GxxExxY protein [Xylanibacter ruminicola]
MLYEEISKKVVHAAHLVHDELGFGFLEAVYGNALYKELCRMGIKCECQKTMDVFYKGDKVGHYIADMVIEDKIVVELKAVVDLRPEHEWQLINYLAASNMNLGLLINFGQSVKVKRKILTKDGKTDEKKAASFIKSRVIRA